MRLRSLCGAAILGLSALCFSKPEVLIVQRLSKVKGANNVLIGLKLSEHIDLEGRVTPILWSTTDPVFRAYLEEKTLPEYVANPDDPTIEEFASRLRVAYVLLVEAVESGGVVRPQATLYDGGMRRVLWSMVRESKKGASRLVVSKDGVIDEEATTALREKYADILADGTMASMTVTINGKPDLESTADTLARTWTQMLAEGPFRQLEPQRRIFSPEPGPSLVFKGPPIQQAAPSLAVDDAITRAQALAKEDRGAAAIIILRDAIDSAPFDVRPRVELIELLNEGGMFKQAASEAMRTASLTKESGPLWTMAADAWIRAGFWDQAHDCANEAMARGQDDPTLTLVLAEVALNSGQLESALENYDKSISRDPSPRALFGRCIARATLGDINASIQDLERAQRSSAIDLDGYRKAMELVSRAMDPIADSLRRVPQDVRVGQQDKGQNEATKILSRVSALVEVLVRLKVPESHKLSHATRDLAYKLLKQSSVYALDFAKTGSEDAATESAISLGQALKLALQFKEQFEIECRYGKTQ